VAQFEIATLRQSQLNRDDTETEKTNPPRFTFWNVCKKTNQKQDCSGSGYRDCEYVHL
jgi:hypothetical protein